MVDLQSSTVCFDPEISLEEGAMKLLAPFAGLLKDHRSLAGFDQEVLRLTYLRFPMVIVEYSQHTVYLGAGYSFQLAKHGFMAGESIPVFKISPRRVTEKIRMAFILSELLLPKLYITRGHGEKKLMGELMSKAGEHGFLLAKPPSLLKSQN